MADQRKNLMGRFLSERMSGQWRLFALGGVFAAVTSVAVACYGLLVKVGMDWLAQAQTDHGDAPVALPFGVGAIGSDRMLWLLPLAIILAALVRSGALYIQTMLNNSAVQKGLVGVQDALFARLIDGDYARLTSAASGEFVSQFINDMNVVRDASLRLASNLVKGVLTVAACLLTMFVLDWALALLVLLVYPIAFTPVVRIGQRLRKTSRHAQEQAGQITALLNEGFQGGRTTKAFNLEDYQKARAHAGFLERARLFMKVLRARAVVDPLLEVVGGAALAGVMAFTGWRVMTGEATVGDLGGFIAAIAAASPEVRALGTLNAVANEGLAALDRIYDVLDAPDAVADAPDAAALGRAQGAVKFSNVSFAFGDAAVLNGLTIEAAPGETIALVGPSGAGKSTVFNILLRLYDPASGVVSVDGRDIRGLTRWSLRDNLSLVSQDAFLFDDTIRANIGAGRAGAAEAEIRAAADAAACDFIAALPGGFDAMAGEGGRNLSGGQRQRIAIARAILRDAPILLMDEATSALDAVAESRVQAALAKVCEGRTTIIIAHRLSTVKAADRIYVIDGGRVVETGRHDDLVRQGGAYAELARLQLS